MHYCPGCSHGVVHKLIAEVIEEMGMEDKAVGISPVSYTHLHLYLWWTLGRRKFGYSQYQRLSYRRIQCIERTPGSRTSLALYLGYKNESLWIWQKIDLEKPENVSLKY